MMFHIKEVEQVEQFKEGEGVTLWRTPWGLGGSQRFS